MLLPRIACEPPLGQLTVAGSDVAEFIVALDWSQSSEQQAPSASYDVAIWHSGGEDGGWAELYLNRIEPSHRHPSQQQQQYFSGLLKRPKGLFQPIHFTLKFKTSGSDWQWLNNIDPQRDGEIVFQTADLPHMGLSDFLQHLDTCWIVDSVHGDPQDAPKDTKLWSLQAKVAAAKGEACGWTHNRLGLPKAVSAWFAIVRHSTPWLGPRQGDGLFSPDKDVILASFLREDGVHLVVLALNGVSDVLTTLSGNEHGHIVVSARNDNPEEARAVVLVATSASFDTAVQTVMDHARIIVDEQDLHVNELSPASINTVDDTLEDWRDGLSYCTWNGVGQTLNEEKILDALDSLAKNGVDISNLIIDDNWQSLDYKGDSNFNYRWTEFDANKENFPRGLKHTISQLRERHPYINHIAVWHGIFGYWNGVSPTGAIAKNYATKEVKKQGHEGYMGNGTTVTVTAEDVHRLYDDFYKFLTSAGVDAVKADVQFYPDYLDSAPDRRAMIYSYQDAWTATVQKYFHGRAISCMSMTPQILFHSLLMRDKPRYMARNSDDFFPFDPSSHTWHIFTNAHNALLTQHLNILPDWDMFQTVHEYAGMHAAARCLSGGPIYITDTPGKHDIKLINQMTAKSIAGRSIILRPASLGTTMEMYVKPSSNRFLRIGTTSFSDSLLGVFNLGDRTRVELLKLASFRGIRAKSSYVVRKHTNGHLFGPFNSYDSSTAVPVQLHPKGYEILTAYRTFTCNNVNAAVLGLLGKMSGSAVRVSYRYHMRENDNVMHLEVGCKAVGMIGLYLSNASTRLEQNDIKASLHILDKVEPLEISATAERDVLQLDTEKAWKTMRGGIGSAVEANLVIQVQCTPSQG